MEDTRTKKPEVLLPQAHGHICGRNSRYAETPGMSGEKCNASIRKLIGCLLESHLEHRRSSIQLRNSVHLARLRLLVLRSRSLVRWLSPWISLAAEQELLHMTWKKAPSTPFTIYSSKNTHHSSCPCTHDNDTFLWRHVDLNSTLTLMFIQPRAQAGDRDLLHQKVENTDQWTTEKNMDTGEQAGWWNTC